MNHQDDDIAEVTATPEAVTLAAALASQSAKHAVGITKLASFIAPLATRCAEEGKVLHVILAGCNTVSLCLPLKNLLSPEVQGKVWLLCTRDTWPGDLATFLWAEYGTNLTSDLTAFRSATRSLLDEFTHHYKRQRIRDVDHNSARSKSFSSLAELVLLDRVDNIQMIEGGLVMAHL